jgi:hypothetical protein
LQAATQGRDRVPPWSEKKVPYSRLLSAWIGSGGGVQTRSVRSGWTPNYLWCR